MKIILDNRLRLIGLKTRYRDELKKHFTWRNPVYWTARKNRRPCAHLEHELVLWQEKDGEISLPRGTINTVKEWLNKQGLHPEETVDQRLLRGIDRPLVFNGKLRDYQQQAIDKALTIGQGVIQAPTGSGKTVIAMGLAARAGTPVLFIVHTSILLNQTVERARQYLGIEPAVIARGKVNIGPFTVALVQTLIRRDLADIGRNFGMVILDEAHHCPASSFKQVIQEFPAYYRFGLTATPERKDKLHPLLYAVMGEKIFDVSNAELLAGGAILKPDLLEVETAFRFRFRRDNYQEMLQAIAKDKKRNELIVNIVKRTHKHRSLVLSERIAHCNLLTEELKAQGLKAAAFTGDIPAEERERISNRFRTAEIDILVATTTLVGEGFDLPQIDTIFLTMPNGNRAKTLQILGRVLRPAQGKRVGRIVDFRDRRVSILERQYQKRKAIYLNFADE